MSYVPELVDRLRAYGWTSQHKNRIRKRKEAVNFAMNYPSTLYTKEDGKEIANCITVMLADVVARTLAAQVIDSVASKAG